MTVIKTDFIRLLVVMTEKEFQHTILPLAKQVYSFAVNMIGNTDDAADITQEVMIKLWDNRKELMHITNRKAWTLKVARNLCLDWLKKHKPAYDDGLVTQNHNYDTDLLHQIEARDTAQAVRKIIDTLPDSQREVMILRELEEMEYDEIAQITGLGLNNIRVLLSRGRAKVKEILVKHYQISKYE